MEEDFFYASNRSLHPKTFEDYLTIIAVGGSTTECFLIADGQDWPAILGEKLKKSFNLVWINNAGLDGHSTFGHNVLMKDYIVKIKPKVVSVSYTHLTLPTNREV